MGIIIGILWFLLVVVMLLLIGIILLQEGKGGGLAEAFGGAGAETFGVKSKGIDRFTAICGGAFLLLAILINVCARVRDKSAAFPGSDTREAPAITPEMTAPPPEVPAPEPEKTQPSDEKN